MNSLDVLNQNSVEINDFIRRSILLADIDYALSLPLDNQQSFDELFNSLLSRIRDEIRNANDNIDMFQSLQNIKVQLSLFIREKRQGLLQVKTVRLQQSMPRIALVYEHEGNIDDRTLNDFHRRNTTSQPLAIKNQYEVLE